jgi:hypothetical protein
VFLLHIEAQHRIDAPLIAGAFGLEVIEHVLVDSDRDRFLLRWNDEDGIGPVDIKRDGVGIVANRFCNFLVCQGIDSRPVSLPAPAIIP